MFLVALSLAFVAVATASDEVSTKEYGVQEYRKEDSYQTRNGYNPAYGVKDAGYKKTEYQSYSGGYANPTPGYNKHDGYDGHNFERRTYSYGYDDKDYGYGPAGYGPAGYGPAGYGPAGYSPAGYGSTGYGYAARPHSSHGSYGNEGYGYQTRTVGYAADRKDGYGYGDGYAAGGEYYQRQEYGHEGYNAYDNQGYGYPSYGSPHRRQPYGIAPAYVSIIIST